MFGIFKAKETIDSVTALAGTVTDGVDKIFTSDDERNAARVRIAQIYEKAYEKIGDAMIADSTGNLIQRIWRPIIGLVCGAALAINFVIFPTVKFIIEASASVLGKTIIINIPAMDIAQIIGLLSILLGLGGMRTAEKIKGAI